MSAGLQTFKVEAGVPIPSGRSAVDYPFFDMKVGDSFFVPAADDQAERMRFRISAASMKFRKREGMNFKFTTRVLKGGVRCWRVK